MKLAPWTVTVHTEVAPSTTLSLAVPGAGEERFGPVPFLDLSAVSLSTRPEARQGWCRAPGRSGLEEGAGGRAPTVPVVSVLWVSISGHYKGHS